MKVKKTLILSLMLPLALASCRQGVTAGRETIPFVRQVAADSAGLFSLVQSYSETGSKGSIAVIGDPEKALLLTERFLTCDLVDNIDAVRKPDGLPDFSGEVFDVTMDPLYTPYEHFVRSDLDSLRELSVRYALATVDSVCLASPFNPDLRLRKSRAKILVYASSLCSEYGRFDVDTLFQMAGKRVAVIDPVHSSLAVAFYGRSGVQHLGLWADSDVIGSGAYQAVFARKYRNGSTLAAFSPVPSGDLRTRFRDFLRQYRDGAPGQLNALLLDDFGVDTSFIMAEVARIREQGSAEDVALNRVLAADFRCIDPMAAMTTVCYFLLRRDNRFTHDIAYPKARFYQAEESAEGYPVLIELSDRYLSAEIGSFMDVNALTTRSFYVSDQY